MYFAQSSVTLSDPTSYNRIVRVVRGVVVIVLESEQGEQVTIEITDVQQTVAIAEVAERQSTVRS